MHKTRRKLEFFVIIIFLVVITVPLLLSDKTGGSVSPLENRYLASAPRLFNHRRLNWQGGELRTQIENWIDDNAYTRSWAKEELSALDISILETPQYDDLLFSDDWVFLWRYSLPDRMLHINVPTEATMNGLLQKARLIHTEMNKRRASFSMTIHPHKADVCYAHLPDTLRVSDGPSMMDRCVETFEGKGDLIVTSSYDTMCEIRDAAPDPNVNPTYYAAYDASHWNRYGAFYGYLSQMQAIAQSHDGVTYFDWKDYDIEPTTVTRTWYSRTFTESDTTFTLRQNRQAIRDDSYLSTTLGTITLSNPWGVNRYYYIPDSDKPTALIVGDSYTWMFFIDDIAESFSQMLYINVEDAGSLWKLMDIYKPDIVSYAGIDFASFLSLCPNP